MNSQLLEFIPLIVFFVVFKLYDLYAAIAALIVVMSFLMILGYALGKKPTPMQIVSLLLILVFGGATVYLRDETFVKWKPTVLNWLFAIVFLGSQFIGKKTLIERVMSSAKIELPRSVWTRLNLAWVVFFIVLGVVNLYVAFNYSTDIWVNFKVFGMLVLTLIFVALQGVYLAKLNAFKDK